MPEYPDVVVYLERLQATVGGVVLEQIRLGNPFLLRTVDPPLSALHGQVVRGFRRMGKRLVFTFDDELFLVIHLMIAGRLRWKKKGASHRGRDVVAVFDFPDGSLVFTEASKKKRASMHLVRGESALDPFDRGGLEIFESDLAAFTDRLRSRRHTLKRALTDPRLFSGIGNAYSDEILWRAQLSPVKMTTSLDDDEVERLFETIQSELTLWTDRFREDVGDGFPDKVTAFRPDMAVHGRYRQPCPRCGNPVQRIVSGDNESNYCVTCQTGGRLLADRALSRLLKSDWPRTLSELDERLGRED
ncbi:MAG: formamidopyrimidine-DNA glycosylase [Myxococcales bacterium]|nr:formamidopyrimidine-DNA glycosylase [Myxococcales bacterium]